MKDYIWLNRETTSRLTTSCSPNAVLLFINLLFDAVDNIVRPSQREILPNGTIRFVWGEMTKRTGIDHTKLCEALAELREKDFVTYAIRTAPKQKIEIVDFESVIKL